MHGVTGAGVRKGGSELGRRADLSHGSHPGRV